MSTIETTMSNEQAETALSAAIGVIGEFRLLVDTLGLGTFVLSEARMIEAQAGLIQMLNQVGDGHPAPALDSVR